MQTCRAFPWRSARPGSFQVAAAVVLLVSASLPPVMILAKLAYFTWYYRKGSDSPRAGELSEPWPRAAIFFVGALLG